MGVTIKDIALRCGLSMATVSKALNYYSDVNDQTRETVRRVAREMGYQAGPLARALKSQCSYHLGALFMDGSGNGHTHYFFSHVLNQFKIEAERRGYDLTFIGHAIGDLSMTYLEHCRLRNVDGVCLGGVDFSSPEIHALYQSGLPVVSIDFAFPQAPAIFSDNAGGMRTLLEYVYSQGHRRIAYVHGNPGEVTNARLRSYREMMAELRLPIPEGYVLQADYHNPESTYRASGQLMRHPQQPTCILVCDDYAVPGAVGAISDAGLRFPEDVSVAGFDGMQMMQQVRPQLTTVQQDTEHIGKAAAEHLIRWIEQPLEVHSQRVVVPALLLPGSTVTRIGAPENVKIDSVL